MVLHSINTLQRTTLFYKFICALIYSSDATDPLNPCKDEL